MELCHLSLWSTFLFNVFCYKTVITCTALHRSADWQGQCPLLLEVRTEVTWASVVNKQGHVYLCAARVHTTSRTWAGKCHPAHVHCVLLFHHIRENTWVHVQYDWKVVEFTVTQAKVWHFNSSLSKLWSWMKLWWKMAASVSQWYRWLGCADAVYGGLKLP